MTPAAAIFELTAAASPKLRAWLKERKKAVKAAAWPAMLEGYWRHGMNLPTQRIRSDGTAAGLVSASTRDREPQAERAVRYLWEQIGEADPDGAMSLTGLHVGVDDGRTFVATIRARALASARARATSETPSIERAYEVLLKWLGDWDGEFSAAQEDARKRYEAACARVAAVRERAALEPAKREAPSKPTTPAGARALARKLRDGLGAAGWKFFVDSNAPVWDDRSSVAVDTVRGAVDMVIENGTFYITFRWRAAKDDTPERGSFMVEWLDQPGTVHVGTRRVRYVKFVDLRDGLRQLAEYIADNPGPGALTDSGTRAEQVSAGFGVLVPAGMAPPRMASERLVGELRAMTSTVIDGGVREVSPSRFKSYEKALYAAWAKTGGGAADLAERIRRGDVEVLTEEGGYSAGRRGGTRAVILEYVVHPFEAT